MRSAASWQYLPLWLYAPYLAKHASGYVPHSTARSVHVTISIPPSATACTAESRNGAAVPYGSRSTTSKRSPAGGRDACISAAASPTCASTAPPSSIPLRRKFSRIAATAPSSRSFATTVRTPGTSFV